MPEEQRNVALISVREKIWNTCTVLHMISTKAQMIKSFVKTFCTCALEMKFANLWSIGIFFLAYTTCWFYLILKNYCYLHCIDVKHYR